MGALNSGYSSRDSLSAGYDCFVARQNLLWQGHDFRGMRRRLGSRTVRGRDLVDHGPAEPAPYPGAASEGGGGLADPPAGNASPLSAPSLAIFETRVLNRAARELNNHRVDQNQIGTLIRTAALLLRSSVTSRSAHDRPTPSLSVLLLRRSSGFPCP